MKISIVIPTLNEEKNIEQCLSSIFSQCLSSNFFEVIIVDGYSKDSTVDIAKQYGNIRIFKLKGNVGKARDFGTKKAKGRIIFHTDADAVIQRREHLWKIKDDFEKHDIIFWQGKAEDPNFPLQNTFMSFVGLFQGGACAANMAFLKETYLKSGKFPNTSIGEDLGLLYRFKKIEPNPSKYLYRNNYPVKMRYNMFEWSRKVVKEVFN